MFKSLISLVALCGMSQFAAADAAYNTDIARLQGSLACTMSKADGGTFDCTVHVKGAGKTSIPMMAETAKDGSTVGYCGMDRISENNMNYTLVVMAGADQALGGVSLITDNKNDAGPTAFNAAVVSSESTSLKAVNITPVSVTFPDDQSVSVSLNFVMYGPAKDQMINSQDTQALTQYLMGKVRPYVLSVSK